MTSGKYLNGNFTVGSLNEVNFLGALFQCAKYSTKLLTFGILSSIPVIDLSKSLKKEIINFGIVIEGMVTKNCELLAFFTMLV